MIDIAHVTTALELFFKINEVKDSHSINLVWSDFDDKFFRWKKGEINNKELYTAMISSSKVVIFKNKEVTEMFKANMDKIFNKEDDYAIDFKHVKSLVVPLEIRTLTDSDIAELKISQEDVIREKKKNAKAIAARKENELLIAKSRKGYAQIVK